VAGGTEVEGEMYTNDIYLILEETELLYTNFLELIG
jgi:hypothetical protein